MNFNLDWRQEEGSIKESISCNIIIQESVWEATIQAVRVEWRLPIHTALAPTSSIGVLLASTALGPQEASRHQ